jgi:hypothetical protein
MCWQQQQAIKQHSRYRRRTAIWNGLNGSSMRRSNRTSPRCDILNRRLERSRRRLRAQAGDLLNFDVKTTTVNRVSGWGADWRRRQSPQERRRGSLGRGSAGGEPPSPTTSRSDRRITRSGQSRRGRSAAVTAVT